MVAGGITGSSSCEICNAGRGLIDDMEGTDGA